jgi:hypothetical protein
MIRDPQICLILVANSDPSVNRTGKNINYSSRMLRTIAGLICGTALLLGGLRTRAQGVLEARLSIDRPGRVEAGTYLAGDRISFAIDAAGTNYLLNFSGSPEIYVLHADNAPLGGRVLKYDSGEAALQVSGWGGLTLYTDSDPAGLPAARTGGFAMPPATPVSLGDVQRAAKYDADYFASVRKLEIVFTADWSALAANAAARATARDAMENVARGIERFCRFGKGRAAVARRVNAVMLGIAGRSTVTLNGKTLFVTFDPDLGYEGRDSSRAIAIALGSLLSVHQNQS